MYNSKEFENLSKKLSKMKKIKLQATTESVCFIDNKTKNS